MQPDAHSFLFKLRRDTEIELGREQGDCSLPRDAYYEGVLALIGALQVVDKDGETGRVSDHDARDLALDDESRPGEGEVSVSGKGMGG